MPTTTETTRSATEDALWAALTDNADTPATAAALADRAGIGVSTARKILARWAHDDLAVRHDDDDNPRAAVHWTIATDDTDTADPTGNDPAPAADTVPVSPDDHADTEPAAAEDNPEPAQPAAAPGAAAEPEPASSDTPAKENNAPAKEKLPPGALRSMVEEYLREHPDGEFTPHQIGKALAHSSGAVHNALVKLTDTGVATQTSAAPKKFTLATPAQS